MTDDRIVNYIIHPQGNRKGVPTAVPTPEGLVLVAGVDQMLEGNARGQKHMEVRTVTGLNGTGLPTTPEDVIEFLRSNPESVFVDDPKPPRNRAHRRQGGRR